MKRGIRHSTKLLAAAVLATGLSTLLAPEALATSGTATSNDDNARQTALVAALHQTLQHPNATGRHICYAAHVEDIGWQPPVCDGAVAGTTGQGLRIEALDVVVSGVGGVCAAGHVEDIGWQAVTCAGDNVSVVVGTTGLGLRMEALDISVNSGGVCANGHVQNIGWQGFVCAAAPAFAMAGTTGQGLRMEAIELTV